MFLSKGVHVLVSNVTIIANYIGFTTVTFRSFNFQGLPYFLLLYLASLGNVSGADQLN